MHLSQCTCRNALVAMHLSQCTCRNALVRRTHSGLKKLPLLVLITLYFYYVLCENLQHRRRGMSLIPGSSYQSRSAVLLPRIYSQGSWEGLSSCSNMNVGPWALINHPKPFSFLPSHRYILASNPTSEDILRTPCALP
jgi:hypothetical protein